MKTRLFPAQRRALLPTLCLASLNLVAFAAAAQDQTQILDPVIVTAERGPQPLSAALAPTIVIERAQIEQMQSIDVAELLQTVAGLDIARTGGPGSVTSVFTRGGESNHTLVLIDGVRVNPATSGGAQLPNIATDMIERVEIVEGPRSTLYGSDAIAGVVNIITRAPQSQQFDASLRGGSYGTLGGTAHYADRIGRYGFALQTEQQTVEGFPSCVGSSNDAAFSNRSYTLRGNADFGATQLEARAWSASGKTEYDDSCSPVYGLNAQALDFRNEALALSASQQLTADWRSALTASRGEDRTRQYQGSGYTRTIRPQLDWDNQWKLPLGNALGFGASFQQDRVDADNGYGSLIGQTTEIWRAFLRDSWDWQRHHLVLAGAHAHYTDTGNADTWNAEYGYDLFTATRLIASAGTGFRAPDTTDRYGFGGNPDLKPERSRSYELGIKQRIGSRQTLDVRAFRNDVSDLILVEFDPSNDPNVDYGFRAVNVDRARTDGVQANWRYESQRWSARVGGIVQTPKDRSDDSLLLRRARRTATAGLTRRLGAFTLGGDVIATSSRADIDAATGAPVTDGGYVLLNLDARYAVTQQWSLAVRGENLLDRDYQTAAGYRQPGASVYATLRYQLH